MYISLLCRDIVYLILPKQFIYTPRMDKYDIVTVEVESQEKRKAFLEYLEREAERWPNSYKCEETEDGEGFTFTLTLLSTAKKAEGIPCMWTDINAWEYCQRTWNFSPQPGLASRTYGWLISHWQGDSKTLGKYKNSHEQKRDDNNMPVEDHKYPKDNSDGPSECDEDDEHDERDETTKTTSYPELFGNPWKDRE